MDLFVFTCCLSIAAVALDRVIAPPAGLEAVGRAWLRAIWLLVAVLWVVMAVQWVVAIWAVR